MELGEIAGTAQRLLPAAERLVVEGLHPEQGLHLEGQRDQVRRLLQEVVCPGLVALPHRLALAECREQDHRERRAVGLADTGARLETVHARQPNVQDHEIAALAGYCLQALLGREGADRRVSPAGQQSDQNLDGRGFVIDDDNPGHVATKAELGRRDGGLDEQVLVFPVEAG